MINKLDKNTTSYNERIHKRHLLYIRIFLPKGPKGWKLLRFIFYSFLGKVMCRPFLCYSPFVQLWVMVKKTKGTSSKRINIKGFMQGIKAWLTFVLKGNGITYYGWKGETFSSQFQLLSTRKQETFSPSHLTFYFLTYIHLSEMEMVSGEDPLFIDIEKWKGEEEDFEWAQLLQAQRFDVNSRNLSATRVDYIINSFRIFNDRL